MSCCGEPKAGLAAGDRIHSKKIVGTSRVGGNEKYTVRYCGPGIVVIGIESASGADLGETAFNRAEFDEKYERCPG
jgi:hypothetical protein